MSIPKPINTPCNEEPRRVEEREQGALFFSSRGTGDGSGGKREGEGER